MTPVPTKAPLASYNGGNNGGTTSGSGGSSYANSGGYSGGYGSYQGGSMAGSSKTGDVRPFKMMAVLGLIGMGLLTGGVVIYRRTVSVTDTGCGIPKEKQATIFQRFEKLNENAQGSGLGLSICQLIIEHIGGKIWIDPNYTNGSRFCFTHPIRQPHTAKGRKGNKI